MSSVRHPTLFQYVKLFLMKPFMEYKWMQNRITVLENFNRIHDDAIKLEADLLKFRKKRDELHLTIERNRDGYHEIKGFCDGIEWVLSGDWEAKK